MVRVNIKSNLIAVVIFLSSSRPQEREGGKGESGTSKTYFFTDFGMDEIEKVIKNSTFHPLFSHFPFEAGKEKNKTSE